VTGRFRARLAERVVDGAAHAEVAREERTSRYQVARAFADRADQREAREIDRPRRLSLDEAHHRRGHDLATVVSDLDRRCVIEVLDGRDRRTIERWLSALPAEVRAGIEVVSIDPYDGYRQAIRAALPHARIVCDHFHLVRGANAALDAVRRERQRQAKARRPKGVRRSGQHAALAPRALPRAPPTAQGPRTPDRTGAPATDRALRARPANRRGLGAEGAVSRSQLSDFDCEGGSGDGPDYTGPVTSSATTTSGSIGMATVPPASRNAVPRLPPQERGQRRPSHVRLLQQSRSPQPKGPS
jgi:hypothetical protein